MLTTAEVAKLSGLPASTLRYYEEKGLIHSVGRQGLQRLFPADVIEQLAFISLARLAKIPLEDVATVFSANGRYEVNSELLLEKVDLLDEKIKELSAIRDELYHVAVCDVPSDYTQRPQFQELLRIAVKKNK